MYYWITIKLKNNKTQYNSNNKLGDSIDIFKNMRLEIK
jgi:hypothetical protein